MTVIVETSDTIVRGRLGVAVFDPELSGKTWSTRDVVVVLVARGVSLDTPTPFVTDPTIVAADVELPLSASPECQPGDDRLFGASDPILVEAVNRGKPVSVFVNTAARDVVIVVEDLVAVTNVVLVCSASNTQPTTPERCNFIVGFPRPPVMLAWLHVDAKPEHCLAYVSANH